MKIDKLHDTIMKSVKILVRYQLMHVFQCAQKCEELGRPECFQYRSFLAPLRVYKETHSSD